jgi:hypothetical protein
LVCLSLCLTACSSAPTSSSSTEPAGEANASTTTDSFKKPTSLDADFADCTEYAGTAAAPLGNLQSRLPAGYTAAAAGDIGFIVVRTVTCKSAKINGGPSHPDTIAQIGVNLVAPAGTTADIDNYALFYMTDDPELDVERRQVGIDSLFDPLVVLTDFTEKNGTTQLFAANFSYQPYVIDSPVIPPNASTEPVDFTANWYQQNGGVNVVMASDYPNILFGDTSTMVTIHVPKGSELAKIFGAEQATFAGLSVFDHIPEGHMHVAATTL